MGLFEGNDFMYKGYNIYKDKSSGKWYVRKGGRYGVNAGTADSKDEAKRIVDGLK